MRLTDVPTIALLQRDGLWGGTAEATPLSSVNSRVMKIETGGRCLVAKYYFQDGTGSRDRLGAEWAFSTYAHALRLDCVPRAIACDRESGIALYEFIEGRALKAGEITTERVAAAGDFFLALNVRPEPRSAMLPAAAEACFSLAEHIALIDQRVARLEHLDDGGAAIDVAAADFVGLLRRHWTERQAAARAAAQRFGWDATTELASEQRCISPSDFGFHNAVLRPSAALAFIDFEYAGWDDPAKMVADFFCQPAIPVPLHEFAGFVERVAAFAWDAGALRQRALLLLPLYRVKWCCIMLNVFLPDAARRRRFADPAAEAEARRALQLEKARRAFAAFASS